MPSLTAQIVPRMFCAGRTSPARAPEIVNFDGLRGLKSWWQYAASAAVPATEAPRR